uniref:RING-type domain-containing protein n=1 Tax=Strongyloides papillosus TaxID=174720 RepID=A0A0N5BY30_STREA
MGVLTLPKTLTCGHTLCSTCLQHLYDASIEANQDSVTEFQLSYSCPICRIEINLVPDSIAVNVTLKKIIDDFSANSLETDTLDCKDFSFRSNGNLCASCKRKIDNLSTYACNTCDNESEIKFYCASCGWKYHSGHDFDKFNPQILINNINVELSELQRNDPLKLLDEKVKEQNLNRINNLAKNYQHLLIVVRNLQTLVMNQNHVTTDIANEIGLILKDINNLMVHSNEKISDIKEKVNNGIFNEEIYYNLEVNFEAIEELKRKLEKKNLILYIDKVYKRFQKVF